MAFAEEKVSKKSKAPLPKQQSFFTQKIMGTGDPLTHWDRDSLFLLKIWKFQKLVTEGRFFCYNGRTVTLL